MRTLLATGLLVVAATAPAPAGATLVQGGQTRTVVISYRAHDGRLRPALLLLPAGYRGQPIPLVISPHGRGQSAKANARFWGEWDHTAEMRSTRRLPRALARFGLLPWSKVPPLPGPARPPRATAA